MYEYLIYNPLFGILFTLFWILIFHIIFIKLCKLNATQWKIVDYIWLSVGIVGVILAISKNQTIAAERQLSIDTMRLRNSHRMILSEMKTNQEYYREFLFVEGPLSPDNFNEIKEQYKLASVWFREWIENSPVLNLEGELPPEFNTPPHPSIVLGSIHENIRHIELQIEFYDFSRNEYLKTLEATRLNIFEALLFATSPFLLAIAASLRLTKVTGEIRLSKVES